MQQVKAAGSVLLGVVAVGVGLPLMIVVALVVSAIPIVLAILFVLWFLSG